MGYVPVLLDLENLRILFVGAGRQAANKMRHFVENGALVRIVSPTLNEGIRPYLDAGRVQWVARQYRPDDLDHMQVVMACTDNAKVNRQVVQEAKDKGILAGNISFEGPRNLQMMAYTKQQSLIVGVSTKGQAPLLSPAILQDISSSMNPKWPRVISWVHRFRQEIAGATSFTERSEMWKQLKTFPFQAWLASIDDQDWNDDEWETNLRRALDRWQE